jgi:hypothetical protein
MSPIRPNRITMGRRAGAIPDALKVRVIQTCSHHCPIGNGFEFAFRRSHRRHRLRYFATQSIGEDTPSTSGLAPSAFKSGAGRPERSAHFGKSARGAELRFGGFLFSGFCRRIGRQRVQKLAGSGLYVVYGAEKSHFIGLRGTVEPADLPDELARRGANLIVGDRRFKVKQGFDASTHDAQIIRAPWIACQRRHCCDATNTALGR